MYGRFQKAIPEDTVSANNTQLYNPAFPAYKRTGYAVKLGLGSDKNYLDFIYMKGRDDSTSIPYQPENYEIYAGENAVFGISHKITIAKKIIWKSDIGISAYTVDLNATELEAEDLPFYSTIKSIITPNVSTQLLTAGETSLSYREKYFSLQLKYRRIDPDYKSMGTYFFQTDLEQYTIAPTFILFKYKLMINSSIGFQHDNLYNRKLSTSARKIGSLNLTYNASQTFGFNIQYSNYGITQNPALAKNMADTALHRYDSLLISQVSQNFAFAPRLNFNSENTTQAINLFIGYQELSDNNKNTSAFSDMTSMNINLSYSLIFLKNNLTISPSLLYTSAKSHYGTLKNTGGTINISKPFLENILFSNAALSYTKNYFENASNGYTMNININLMIRPSRNSKQGFNINALWMKNRAEDETLTRDFSEFTGTFGYTVNF